MTTSCQQEEFAQPLAVQEIPRSYTPVSLNDRQIYVQHKNGSLDRVMLRAKECLKGFENLMKEPDQDSDEEKAKSTFFELIQLGRLHDARYLGSRFRNASWLESLGNSEHLLFVSLCFVKVNDVFKVWMCPLLLKFIVTSRPLL